MHTVDEQTIYGLMPDWDTQTNELLRIDIEQGNYESLCVLSKQLQAVAINSDGELFGVSGSSLYLVDPISGKMQFVHKFAFAPTSMAFNWDHHLILTKVYTHSNYNSNLGLYDYDPASGMVLNVFGVGVEYYAPGSLAISPRGEFYTINGSMHLAIPDTLTNNVQSVELDTYYIKDLFFDFEGDLYGLFDTAADKFQLRKIDIPTGKTELQALEFPRMVALAKYSFFSEVLKASPDQPAANYSVNCYPNPSSEVLNISFELLSPQFAELQIVDLNGRIVFAHEQYYDVPGQQLIKWDGVNSAGLKVPPGVYLLHFKAGEGFSSAKRIVLTP